MRRGNFLLKGFKTPRPLRWNALRASAFLLAWGVGVMPLSATDFVVHLPDTPSVSRQSITYQCDATGQNIGVPSGPFSVEYINGGGNSLVIIPILGNALIFSNVSAASGVRFTAQQYTWWEAKGAVTLYSDSINGKLQSSCHEIAARSSDRRKE